jgi:phosphatidylserine decarboxylase
MREMPRDPFSIISPCDALITECGRVTDKTIFQIKGVSYSVDPLLLNIDAKIFEGGSYQNFYLSPRDYHHYHAPCDLKLIRVVHIPGRLYPVNKLFLRNKRNLFCLNERAILEAKDHNGKRWILVFVAALNVGKIFFEFMPEFENLINAEHSSEHRLNMSVKRGDSLGYFKMGSTIVMISQEGAADFNVASGCKVKFSEEIGILSKS